MILTYDALNTSHTISGFGGQIWMDDQNRAIRIARDQGWSMLRTPIEDKKPNDSKPKLDGTKRPVYYAMKTLSTVVPTGAFVLKSPPFAESGIYAAAFITGDRFIVAFANGTAEQHDTTVNVKNASISFLKAEAMVNGVIESKIITVANNSFALVLPGDSTLVMTFTMST